LDTIKILFVGDIVGAPGREIIRARLSDVASAVGADFVIANAENASGGSGLSLSAAAELFESGIHAVTMGDHVWRQLEIVTLLENDPRVIRPLNYPEDSAGRGFTILDGPGGAKIAVVNALGRVYMKPIDCPFRAIEGVLDEIYEHTRVVIVDFHAEATSEKIAMGWFLDGRVSAVLGTHTHVQTADARILPCDTAYITDVGMTGPHDGVIGRRKDRVLLAMISLMPYRFDVATEDVRISAAVVEVEPRTGRAVSIESMTVDENGNRLRPHGYAKGSGD